MERLEELGYRAVKSSLNSSNVFIKEEIFLIVKLIAIINLTKLSHCQQPNS